jgi:hypothetical protein
MVNGNNKKSSWINFRYFAVHEPETLAIASFTDQLLGDLIGMAREWDIEHQLKINTIQDNTLLVTKTL